MKNLKYSLAAKITAIFLFLLCAVLAIGGSAGIVYMESQGYYSKDGGSFYNSQFCFDTTHEYANELYYNYFPLLQKHDRSSDDKYSLKYYQKQFAAENSNFLFTITNEAGETLLSNYQGQPYGTRLSFDYAQPNEGEQFNVYEENGQKYFIDDKGDRHPYQQPETYTVTAYVKDPITAQDNYLTAYNNYSLFYSLRYIAIVVTAIATVCAVLLFIFLMSAAGHRKGREEVVLNPLDKIPLDLYALGMIIITFGMAVAGHDILYYWRNSLWLAGAAYAAIIAIGMLFVLGFCLTLATRIKVGKWWRNTIIYMILRLIVKAFRAIFGNLPLLWKTVVYFLGFIFINGILFAIGGEAFFIAFLFNLFVIYKLCQGTIQMNKLKIGGEKIAAGDLECKIDTQKMFSDLKKHGESLNNISLGMSKAVEERLKSERLKTELITNVSHDLKTPLTSIVNYVDLLKKERIENANARQYIEVLDRQTAKLKKLTEDLVEASKASTGNVTVNLQPTNVVELLNQSIAEYSERFAADDLEAIINTPQNEIQIMADGRLLWRVFDNLLNNICKYSQPHTRVYLDAASKSGQVAVTFKNISKYPLNITSEELLERFVRGDSSRSTEGSGLGLSIAKSLTELQKGSFDLSVDGDLFKVIIQFEALD
ncbi:MAG: sensor histidine kinase [Bacillota bacterium]|jgi:signal transduction histidine kinase